MQTTNHVLMVRPAAFSGNQETQQSNYFQKCVGEMTGVAEKAQAAFDLYVNALSHAGVTVKVIEELPGQQTPDSLFPNNWIALLPDGTLYTFPMEALNRRRERRQDIIAQLAGEFSIGRRIDLSQYESQQHYLEGTGSLIFDHPNKLAYACRSSRSSPEVGREFERLSGYRIIWFTARDRHLHPIYHTNVMLSIGSRFAIVCLDTLPSQKERQQLIAHFMETGKTVIDVSLAQMESFACNVLELRSADNTPVYAMSTRAWSIFSPEQQQLIAGYARLALGPIDIIEDLGGGGARCMLCEVFPEKRMAFS